MPLPASCTCLASLSRARSATSHSKMQVASFERKTEYRGWVSVDVLVVEEGVGGAGRAEACFNSLAGAFTR